MSEPPRPKPANATIEIDKSDLDEILNAMPSGASLQASVPPPLPPEEIARAHSMAPVMPVGSQAAPHAKPSLLPYIVISAAIMVVAGIAVGVMFYLHGSHQDAAPIASAAPSAAATAPESSASTAPASTTLTIHTVELGGKPSE